ncbi:glutaredoxin family protein [Jiangella ureilytica]|uniref:Glutaredoxin family protein n=1 Tax=Jiangella ureilytica TaxID=2530374 RepID=A0A4R4RE12_9ACTN|nr:glutaredoxin family protein [Jiangella ureilytica]TDC47558.1 glutaredoxin family protein [Jiangella ureilytica]
MTDTNTDPGARVLLLGKPGCHLCDDARTVVEAVCAELGVGWEERSIVGEPELERRYGEQIPVTFVDGAQHDFWRVDADRLRRALTGGL